MEPTEFNALAFDQNSTKDPLQKHFIPREGSRRKGVEIEFDPSRHREWVTGFRKRKAERKTAARKGLEIKAKEERLVDRKQRFEEKKRNLNLPDDYGVGNLDEDDQVSCERVTDQKQHRQAGLTTVVTTSAIAYDSDEQQESELSDPSEGGEQHFPLGVLAPAAPQQLANKDEGAGTRSAGPQGQKPKSRVSSADRLARLRQTQGKKTASQKSRGGKAPRKGKGKPGRGRGR
eukprot:jgi/Ulvmu1/5224/UM022_0017.1